MRASPQKPSKISDLLLKFFGEGERWIKGRFSDRRGNCGLVGALDSSAAIMQSGAQRPSGIWRTSFPMKGTGVFVTIRMVPTMPGCGRPFAAPCGAKGIRPAKRF
jgi:hypothetical protein